MDLVNKFFKISESGSTYKREIVAGITTFSSMAYIIVVNPKILEHAKIPLQSSMVATILIAIFGTLIMGLYARRPFAIASYMGENAFIAFTVVGVLGFSWQQALAAIFISGVLFILITISHIRKRIVEAIPLCLKVGFSVGIGFFLTFIGLINTGIVRVGNNNIPVHIGDFRDATVLLAILGFLIMGFLMIRRVFASILIGIIVITILSFVFKPDTLPKAILSMPPSILPTFLKMEFNGILTWSFFPVVLTLFVMVFVDTMGTLIGISMTAGFLDKEGNLPEIEKPMLCNALSTTVASILGTTPSGAYLESATGIVSGGRTGFASLITALLFSTTLFLFPLVASIPACAYGPALIIVGMLMIFPIAKINFSDITEVISVFTIIIMMAFTYNIGFGITAGFVIYPLTKIITGNVKQISVGLWILSALSLLFFIFYPY